MRAHEFIDEALGPAPGTEWLPQPGWDPAAQGSEAPITANWTDKTGSPVQTKFVKIAPNVATVSFTRPDAEGNPTFKRTDDASKFSPHIFNGVANNVKDYLNDNPDISHITFGSQNDADRTRLYSKLAKRANVIGMEPVDLTDKSSLPPVLARMTSQQDKNVAQQNVLNQIPSISKTPSNTPTLTKGPAEKYDQFVLRRAPTSSVPLVKTPAGMTSVPGLDRLPNPGNVISDPLNMTPKPIKFPTNRPNH
jgi:hypothetical protein